MKEKEQTQLPEDLIRQTENFWDDPQKVMYLVDLLFLFDNPSKIQMYS